MTETPTVGTLEARCPGCGEPIAGYENKIIRDPAGVLLYHEECGLREKWGTRN